MPKPSNPDLRKKLREALDEAEWTWLKPHSERDSVVLVAQELDLLDVGEKIANDDSALVQQWISKGKVNKPTAQQIHSWEANSSKRFLTLIVQPYVLIQEKAH